MANQLQTAPKNGSKKNIKPSTNGKAVSNGEATLIGRSDNQQVDRAAAMLKVLAHPKRMAIVDLLGKEEKMTVTEIYTQLEMPQAIASQHLITLKDRGVLKSVKAGTKIYYSLSVPQLTDVIRCLEDCIEEM